MSRPLSPLSASKRRPSRRVLWLLLIPFGALLAALPTACVVMDDHGYDSYGGSRGYGPVGSGIYRPPTRYYDPYASRHRSYGGYGQHHGYCPVEHQSRLSQNEQRAEQQKEYQKEAARERSKTPRRFSSEVASEQRRLRDNEEGWERKKAENRKRGRM